MADSNIADMAAQFNSKSLRNMTKEEKQDDCIMNTNGSSIVSKRSVEKLYYPKEPQLYRHFVKKFQRRAPLINRGYWLRMRAIENAVTDFLDESCAKRRLVINLGCGYDTLAFKLLNRRKYQKCTFVDVDYPDLMRKKVSVLLEEAVFRDMLPGIDSTESDGGIMIRSDNYIAMACDLRNRGKLETLMAEVVGGSDCSFLFVAEVSITYMDVESANSLIEWAASLRDVRFCLLEQYLPDEPDHPFAQTMLKHFEKLQTPLQAVHRYPSIEHQRLRFGELGWRRIRAQSLWSLWANSGCISSEERKNLDRFELFDEWEELALFASHYFLLVADQQGVQPDGRDRNSTQSSIHSIEATILASPNQHSRGHRRFGAPMRIDTDSICFHGGLTTQGRSSSTDTYSAADSRRRSAPSPLLRAYMCHTVTELQDGQSLLVGGRTSPDQASSECWLYQDDIWRETQSLSPGRFRHCATKVWHPQHGDGNVGVLVFGGKTASGLVLNDWMLWTEQTGWRKLEVLGERPGPRFGACMAASSNASTNGILIGGMTQDGIVMREVWKWQVMPDLENVTCTNVSSLLEPNILQKVSRFGAGLAQSPWGYVIAGGVRADNLLRYEDEILALSEDLAFLRLQLRSTVPRPLLVGNGIFCTEDGKLLLFGGGATCFSFGTCWNTNCYTIQGPLNAETVAWHLCHTDEHGAKILDTGKKHGVTSINETKLERRAIPRVRIESTDDFHQLLAQSRPAIIESLHIGSCIESWTIESLKERVGHDRKVTVHSSPTRNMSFTNKNFSYTTMSFGDFLDSVGSGEKLYLRSLSSSRPAEEPAYFQRDFPTIAADFELPAALSHATANAHSSVLRISGPVTMWLHYDVQANLLCQVRGRKRLILYPPSDVTRLRFAPGASSSSIDPFAEEGGRGQEALASSHGAVHPHEAYLEPGDVLFIPELWPHCAAPTENISIAVNIFFRSLDKGYAPGRDVYGNRDLQPYEEGRKGIDKIAKSFDKLPGHVRRFYMERLASELMDKASGS